MSGPLEHHPTDLTAVRRGRRSDRHERRSWVRHEADPRREVDTTDTTDTSDTTDTGPA
jgi:hypothetical protein